MEQNIGMYGTECHRGLWALTISPALCPRKARERQEPRRSEMAFTNLRPAVASAPAADDEQHYLHYFLHYLLILMYKVGAISVSV